MNFEEKKITLLKELNELRAKYAKMTVDGERVCIPNDYEGIDVVIYKPNSKAHNLPVMIEVHGGAWIAGDAVLVNSLCKKIAKETPAVVINLNYKKLDQHPFPYQQYELMDTVRWVKENAKELGADPDKIFICGQSAGGHICATGAILMKQNNVSICEQILIYPTTDYALLKELPESSGLNVLPEFQQKAFFPDYSIKQDLISPMHTSIEFVSGVAQTTIIVCGDDVLKQMGIDYAHWLNCAGVSVTLKEYPHARHGFLETNREESFDCPDNSPEQDTMARECEQYLIEILRQAIVN